MCCVPRLKPLEAVSMTLASKFRMWRQLQRKKKNYYTLIALHAPSVLFSPTVSRKCRLCEQVCEKRKEKKRRPKEASLFSRCSARRRKQIVIKTAEVSHSARVHWFSLCETFRTCSRSASAMRMQDCAGCVKETQKDPANISSSSVRNGTGSLPLFSISFLTLTNTSSARQDD